MPGIFYRPIDRRQFLSSTSKALAALALAGRARALAQDASATEKPVHLALLSDTHIPADPKNGYRNFLPTENLKSIVTQVLAAQPEAIILNGDAARTTGELADYAVVKELLAPLAAEHPIYFTLGNHDDRDNFHKVFDHPAGAVQDVKEKHVLVVEHPALRFVLLDSLLHVSKTPGFLGKAQRDWLAQHLEKSDARATVLFVHHTLGDGDTDLLDAERLFRIIKPHKKVKAIFYGHSHQYRFSEQQGVHLVNIPAVGYNFNDNEPVGWTDAVFTSSGVELALKALGGNRKDDGKLVKLTWGT
jgi:Icc protein